MHEADAALYQPASQQAAHPEIRRVLLVQAIHEPGGLTFLGNVNGFGRVALHLECQLVRADARREFRISVRGVQIIHLLQQFESSVLTPGGHSGRWFQIQNGIWAASEQRSLVDSGQKAGVPARCSAFRRAFGLRHHNVGRKIITLATQAISDPGAHARVAH